MELTRKDVLTALKTVEPALGVQVNVPLLRQFWFTGAVIQATDGTIGIEAPLQTDFTGGIPGKVLLGFIESLETEKIKAAKVDEHVEFSAGRSRMKFPLEPMRGAPWPFRETNAEADSIITITDDWRAALSFSMLSVISSSNHVERRGVTFAPEESIQVLNAKEAKKQKVDKVTLHTLVLYSTDGASISCARMEEPEQWTSERFTLPGDYMKEILKQVASGDALSVWSNYVEAKTAAGVRLLTRMLDVEKPQDFRSAIKRHTPPKPPIGLPDGLKTALERAELLKTDRDVLPATFTFTEDATLTIVATSNSGDFNEELQFEGTHPNITVRLDPEVILRGLTGRTKFITSNRAMVFQGPDHLTYLVSAYGGK